MLKKVSGRSCKSGRRSGRTDENSDTETRRRGDTEKRLPVKERTRRQGDGEKRGRLCLPIPPSVRLPLFFFALVFLTLLLNLSAGAQTGKRSGAHSSIARDTFSAADRNTVEKAIGTACAERVRDPLGSTPIDEMQARPSLSASNPDAVAGARRADRLLQATRKLVANAIVELSQEYGLYDAPSYHARVNAASARVQAVKRIRPNVDARDNASVVLRDPRVIEFGTIFLAGLKSDEAMVSVLGHELTHVASGQSDSLRPLFRAIARRAASRINLSISGQRAEELACDLIGLLATRQFINETPSWEPQPRRIARAVEHNCVDDDSSDEDHLSPRNTIRALFALDLDLARELLAAESQASSRNTLLLTADAAAF